MRQLTWPRQIRTLPVLLLISGFLGVAALVTMVHAERDELDQVEWTVESPLRGQTICRQDIVQCLGRAPKGRVPFDTVMTDSAGNQSRSSGGSTIPCGNEVFKWWGAGYPPRDRNGKEIDWAPGEARATVNSNGRVVAEVRFEFKKCDVE